MPWFSVVVPAYNAADTIGETLEAVLAQTCDDWECVVVDDGSTDGTLAIAESFERRDPRFRVISQANKGTGGAYNTGVSAACGSWVTLCSADDVLLPPHLDVMRRAIEQRGDTDIFSCNGYFWRADGARDPVYSDQRSSEFHSWSLEEMLMRSFFGVGACYRRTLFLATGGYLEDAYGEDYDFWLRAMAGGAVALFVPEPLALHRISASQKSANLERAFESDIRSISGVLESGLLSPRQRWVARAAIRLRRRMIHDLAEPDNLSARIRRSLRSAAARLRRR